MMQNAQVQNAPTHSRALTEQQQRQAKTIAVAELMRLFVYELRWESYRIVGELGATITQKRMRYEMLLPWGDSAAGEKTK